MGISHVPRTTDKAYEADPEADSPTRRACKATGPGAPLTMGRIRYQQPRTENATFGTPEFTSFSTPKRDLKRKRSAYELTPVIKRKMVFGEEQEGEQKYASESGEAETHEEIGDWEVVRKEKRTESYGSFWNLGAQASPEEDKEQEGIIRKQLKF